MSVEFFTKEDFDLFYSLLIPGVFNSEVVSEDNVDPLLRMSDYYQVNFIKEGCAEGLLKLPVSCDRLLQAHQHGLSKQYHRCLEALARKCSHEDMLKIQAASPVVLFDLAERMRCLLQETEPRAETAGAQIEPRGMPDTSESESEQSSFDLFG